jgi:hypothetical protein
MSSRTQNNTDGNPEKKLSDLDRLHLRLRGLEREHLIGLDVFGVDNVANVKTKAYLKIRERFSQFSKDPKVLNPLAYKTWLLFRSYDKALQYSRTHSHSEEKDEHKNLINLMLYVVHSFPVLFFWKNVAFDAWGDFLIHCSDRDVGNRTFAKLSGSTSPVYHDNGKINVGATVYSQSYHDNLSYMLNERRWSKNEAAHKYLICAKEAYQHSDVPPEIFDQAFQAFIKLSPPVMPDPEESIPEFKIQG